MGLEKAFDTVPWDKMMMVLVEQYWLKKNMIEVVQWMHTNMLEKAVGHKNMFSMTMVVKLGCPLSPTLFRLYFERVSDYVWSTLPYGNQCNSKKEWVT